MLLPILYKIIIEKLLFTFRSFILNFLNIYFPTLAKCSIDIKQTVYYWLFLALLILLIWLKARQQNNYLFDWSGGQFAPIASKSREATGRLSLSGSSGLCVIFVSGRTSPAQPCICICMAPRQRITARRRAPR